MLICPTLDYMSVCRASQQGKIRTCMKMRHSSAVRLLNMSNYRVGRGMMGETYDKIVAEPMHISPRNCMMRRPASR